MALTATQLQIDSLASFVEACSELEKEAFFGRDEKNTFRNVGSTFTFILGDRFHFRSALISFRRVWMANEPSHWGKVEKILVQPDMPSGIKTAAKFHAQRIREIKGAKKHMLKFEVASDRIIDLWLNTVFAHGGVSGKNKRADFEAISDKYGHALFEYTFRNLVKKLGKEFCNLSNLAAKEALDEFNRKCNLLPSFRIGAAFGTKRRERTKDGHLILRQGSSEHFSEETFEERFSRILSRFQHEHLKFIFGQLDRSSGELLRATLKSKSMKSFFEICDGRLEITDTELPTGPPIAGFRASCTVALNFGLEAPGARVNISDEPALITTAKGEEILNVLLHQFRSDLVED